MIYMSKAIHSFSVGQYILYCLAAKNVTELKISGHIFKKQQELLPSKARCIKTAWNIGEIDVKECMTCGV